MAGQKVALPSLDIVSIGAGGGSIARVDAGGTLRVGPESAGAEPGPACYGKGGTAATVTDANLVLGYLDPGNFLGGRTPARPRRRRSGPSTRSRSALGTERMVAAEGIHRVINTVMAEGIRVVSVRRGVDPRRFALLAFGGAAALHVTDVARRLEIGRVVVPRVAAVLSAWGMLATDLRYEAVRTHIGDARRVGAAQLRQVFATMEAEGRRRLAEAFSGPVRVQRAVDMRYGEQIFEVNVSLGDVDLEAPDAMAEIVARFHKRHEELYTYAAPDQEVVLVNARLAVVGELPALPEEPRAPRAGPRGAPQPAARLSGRVARGAGLRSRRGGAGAGRSTGPAIVEAATTTALLRAGERATVTPLGWLDIRIVAVRVRSPHEPGERRLGWARGSTIPRSRSRALFERARQVIPGRDLEGEPPRPPAPVLPRRGSRLPRDRRRRGRAARRDQQLHGADPRPRLPPARRRGQPAAPRAARRSPRRRPRRSPWPSSSSSGCPGLERVRFGNSGTEAVMMAIKAARAYTGRDRIAKFEGAYHGYYDDVQVSFSSRPGRLGAGRRAGQRALVGRRAQAPRARDAGPALERPRCLRAAA